jgi:hypothetical protein
LGKIPATCGGMVASCSTCCGDRFLKIWGISSGVMPGVGSMRSLSSTDFP